MQFTVTAPRTGENNITVAATLDRVNAAALLAALPLGKGTREQIGDTQSDVFRPDTKSRGIPQKQ